MTYYVIKNKTTGEYYRGKGVNKWGKYFNQASIFRVKGTVMSSWEELSRRGDDVEIVPIQIVETTNKVAEVCHGEWNRKYKSGNEVSVGWVSSCCDMWNERKSDFCPYCGAQMS
jgi:hypothetical protein